MPYSEADIIRLLVNGKKDLPELKNGLRLKNNEEEDFRSTLQRLVKRGSIQKTESGGIHYYALAAGPQGGDAYAKIRRLVSAAISFYHRYEKYFYAAAVASVILAYTAVYANLFLSLKQIPGPMYGGDYYLHYGIINSIYNGNAPWTCSEYQGEYAFHPWLLHLAVAFIGKITGDLLASFLVYFPVIVVISSGVVSYLLGRELFKDRSFALLFCLAWMGSYLGVNYIPANYTPAVTSPLLLLSVFKALRTGKTKWIVLGGISFGLFVMSHIAALPAGALLLGLIYICYFLGGNFKPDLDPDSMRVLFKIDRPALRASILRTSKIIIPVAVIGLLIGLLYWGPIFFVYKFNVKNPGGDYADDYAAYGLTMAQETIQNYLFNIGPLLKNPGLEGVKTFSLSLLTLVGLGGAIKNRREGSSSFMAVTFAAGLIGSMHYIVTLPLLNATYAPPRIAGFILGPAAFILMIYGIYLLYGFIRTDTWKKIFLSAVFLFFIMQAKEKIDGEYKVQWTLVGQSPQNPATEAMASWIKENTDKNAVFLSIEELSFALNGQTGRKLVNTRRTHSNPYIDINERLADTAVMLYGTNEERTMQLLKAYNVSYLYWDGAWPTIAEREPTLVSPKYAEYLTKYGVGYREVITYMDPAWSDRFKKYSMLMVIQAKNDPMQPWSDVLHKHLTPVKEIDIEGQAAYRIYQVV
jgi:hypothetical protein